MYSAIAACSTLNSEDEILEFIPGTYIAYYENEFHKTNDTLTIQENTAAQNVYVIKRRYYYTTEVDGRNLTPTYKKEEWTALFDAEHNILMEQRHGSIISFDIENKMLKRGSREYRKLE
jgi:hypothetical protein